jgi:hypothetical protein
VRPTVNTLRVWVAAAALEMALPMAANAQDPRLQAPEERGGQASESRWVTSLAATSGVLIQQQHGSVTSCLFANPADATGCPAPGSTPLRPAVSGSSRAVSAFVGANFEAMSPALPIPMRPRLFLSGEIIPTFASDNEPAVQGDTGCVKGPELGSPCAKDQPLPLERPYGEDAANGQGSVVETTYSTLSYGANFGVAFPVQVRERRVRIKPSVGWISYEVEASGTVVDAECEPPTRCADVAPPHPAAGPGALREVSLTGDDRQRFHAIGPGLDVEVDTGRFGPLGTSLFVAGRAYRTLGDRSFEFESTQVYGNDGLPLANQAVSARWETEVDPWMYRVGVGLRLQWLGFPK